MTVETTDLRKTYTRFGQTIHALDGVNVKIESGEFIAIHGPSGCGKSTLLLHLGGMLRPTSGTVRYQQTDLYALSTWRRARFRRQTVGFVFQKFYLMPYLSVYDNIRLLLSIQRKRADRGRIEALAERLGIAERLRHRPAELSVGEQQRVAMARTLAGDPELILADEPTGNLDRVNREILAQCFQEEHAKGRTIVLATHDERLLELGSRKVELVQGRVVEP